MQGGSNSRKKEEEGGKIVLLLLLDMQRMFAEARGVLLQLQLLATRASSQGVVVVAGFFAHEEYGFQLFLLFPIRQMNFL